MYTKEAHKLDIAGDGFTIGQVRDGAPVYCFIKRWSDAVAAAIVEHGATHFGLWDTYEGDGTELRALGRLADQVKELNPGNTRRIDLGFVNEMHALASLTIDQAVDGVDFSRLTGLKELVLSGKVDLSSVARVRSLDRLLLSKSKVKSLAPLGAMQRIGRLDVWQEHSLESLDGIQGVAIEALEVTYNRKLKSVKAINGCKTLKRIEWSGCSGVTDLEEVTDLPALQRFSMTSGPTLSNFTFLRRWHALEEFHISNSNVSSATCSVSPFVGLEKLRVISLWAAQAKGFKMLTDVERLGECPLLEELWLTRIAPLENVKFLTGLSKLRYLYLGTTDIKDGDFSVLMALPELRDVTAYPVKKHWRIRELQLQLLRRWQADKENGVEVRQPPLGSLQYLQLKPEQS